MTATWRRATDVVWRAVPGYLALARTDGKRVEVHGPGADVWREITQPTDLEQVVENLATRYSADHATVLGDVRRLLESLEEDRYVTKDG